jgi:hypothetical protein
VLACNGSILVIGKVLTFGASCRRQFDRINCTIKIAMTNWILIILFINLIESNINYQNLIPFTKLHHQKAEVKFIFMPRVSNIWVIEGHIPLVGVYHYPRPL